MSEPLQSVPPSCAQALDALQADPLEPSPEVLRHLRGCPACAEARILWLAADDDAVLPLAPAGYFDRLPGRILGKLPAPAPPPRRAHPFLWSLAATLLLGVGTAAFWAGKANRTPVVEATLPHAPAEMQAEGLDTPFRNGDEVLDQISTLTPEESRALIEHMTTKEVRR